MSAALISLLGLGANLIGGQMDRQANAKATAAANAANTPLAQRKAYEAAGINPIVGMQSGSYVPQQAVPMSDQFAMAGAQFSNTLAAGLQATLQKTALKSENTDLKKKLDDAATMGAPSHMASYGVELPNRSILTDMGVRKLSDVRDPTPIKPNGLIDTSIDDGGTGATIKPVERVVSKNGTSQDIEVGPDLDELITGYALGRTADFNYIREKSGLSAAMRTVASGLPGARLMSGYQDFRQTISQMASEITPRPSQPATSIRW